VCVCVGVPALVCYAMFNAKAVACYADVLARNRVT